MLARIAIKYDNSCMTGAELILRPNLSNLEEFMSNFYLAKIGAAFLLVSNRLTEVSNQEVTVCTQGIISSALMDIEAKDYKAYLNSQDSDSSTRAELTLVQDQAIKWIYDHKNPDNRLKQVSIIGASAIPTEAWLLAIYQAQRPKAYFVVRGSDDEVIERRIANEGFSGLSALPVKKHY